MKRLSNSELSSRIDRRRVRLSEIQQELVGLHEKRRVAKAELLEFSTGFDGGYFHELFLLSKKAVDFHNQIELLKLENKHLTVQQREEKKEFRSRIRNNRNRVKAAVQRYLMKVEKHAAWLADPANAELARKYHAVESHLPVFEYVERG